MSDRIREDEEMLDLEIRTDARTLGRLVGASIEGCQMQNAMLVLGGVRTIEGKRRRGAKKTMRGVEVVSTKLHRELVRAGARHSDRPRVRSD